MSTGTRHVPGTGTSLFLEYPCFRVNKCCTLIFDNFASVSRFVDGMLSSTMVLNCNCSCDVITTFVVAPQFKTLLLFSKCYPLINDNFAFWFANHCLQGGLGEETPSLERGIHINVAALLVGL